MRKLRATILKNHPHCIYCGGNDVASTIDHVPPRVIFDLKHRPKGLEFPACEKCNAGAKLDEQIAAMLSRVYPDPIFGDAEAEIKNIFAAVNNNSPGLLEEMMPSFRQEKNFRSNSDSLPADVHALNCNGPLLNHAIHRFAAKLGYALHFELTGKPVPIGGGACAWWVPNFQVIKGEFPDEILSIMGNPRTLRQGDWDVGDQFRYASIGTEDGGMTAHFASFRLSFAIWSFVAERVENVRPPSDVRHVTLHAPGWLKEPRPQKDQFDPDLLKGRRHAWRISFNKH